MELIKGSDGLANSAKATTCEAIIQATNITFYGSNFLIDWGLTKIVSAFEEALESEIDQVTCTQLSQLVDENMTQYLQEIDAKIRPFLTPSDPSPAPPVPPTGMMTQVFVLRKRNHSVT
jgi:hypothetical protein